jgi:hypothetical protein
MAKLPGPTITVNVGLVLVIALSIYLIWNMMSFMRKRNEKFEGLYAPAEFYREAEDESFAELTDLGESFDDYEEAYGELEDVDETFAPLESEAGATVWGDGSAIGSGAPVPTYSPMLIETAHVSDGANALFSA